MFLLYFLHLMGVFWEVTGYLGQVNDYLAGPFIIVVGLYSFYLFKRIYGIIWPMLLVFLLGFTLETVGWMSGFPYGNFSYTEELIPQIAGTPVAIGFAWASVVISGAVLAKGILSHVISSKIMTVAVNAIGAGLLALLLDILMEPIAIDLGWWVWDDGVPPLSNFVTWFIAAMLFSGMPLKVINGMVPKDSSAYRVVPHIYISQLLYFLLMTLIIL